MSLVRQSSLQHPPEAKPPQRRDLRRHKSTDDERPSLLRRNNAKSAKELVRLKLWEQDHQEQTTKIKTVEVVACKAPSKLKPSSARQKFAGRTLTLDRSTILYTREELAERLRLAWKRREENKSNIDIFLAHGSVEERCCDSRMSNNDKSSPTDDDKLPKIIVKNDSSKENLTTTAKQKRASFASGMNKAFNGQVNLKKELLLVRTNSAPATRRSDSDEKIEENKVVKDVVPPPPKTTVSNRQVTKTFSINWKY